MDTILVIADATRELLRICDAIECSAETFNEVLSVVNDLQTHAIKLQLAEHGFKVRELPVSELETGDLNGLPFKSALPSFGRSS